MSKVTKNSVIERIDTDRVGDDVIYLYATPELAEEDPAHTVRISEQELIQFCIDFELAEDEYGAIQLLHDAFEDIIDQYWDNVEHPKLVIAYEEALAYLNTYTRQLKKPMDQGQVVALYDHIERTFGIQIGRRAA